MSTVEGATVDDPVEEYRLLIAEVFELAGRSRASSDRLAHELGHTAAQWHAMSVISDADLNVPSIARRLGLARQSVQRVVDDLVESDLVALAPNPDHARSPLVTLTETGRTTLDSMFDASTASRRALLTEAGLDAGQLAAARNTLRALLGSFDQDAMSD